MNCHYMEDLNYQQHIDLTIWAFLLMVNPEGIYNFLFFGGKKWLLIAFQ